ncbi:MAG TPA: FKBP-type peptidyl-prolyl cis-trans isomerase [Lacipirellulaceae bacterium]|nr:FKBP-type peptidyl-prolyl cis-trans isomerase [Lacipirellulaceae bacterium]
MRKLLMCAALAFLAAGCNSDNNANPNDPSQVNIEFTTTDLVVGSGAQAATGNRVTVNYTGWLYNQAGVESKGTQFDSSVQAGRTPLEFVIGGSNIIPGFQQGVVGMRIGGKRRVYMPSNLAYGSSGSQDGRIPPNAALVFELDLLTLVQ